MVTFSVSCDFFVLGPGVLKRDVIISKLHSFDIDCWYSSAHTLLHWWSVWCHWSWWLWWRILQATMTGHGMFSIWIMHSILQWKVQRCSRSAEVFFVRLTVLPLPGDPPYFRLCRHCLIATWAWKSFSRLHHSEMWFSHSQRWWLTVPDDSTNETEIIIQNHNKVHANSEVPKYNN